MVAITGTDSLHAREKFKIGFDLKSVSTGLTAFAGGGQAGALPLVSRINRLATVASAADSVMLPLAELGMEIVIINDGASAAQVFGSGVDTIDGIATATGVPLTNTKRAIFYCTVAATPSVAGKWHSLMGVPSA